MEEKIQNDELLGLIYEYIELYESEDKDEDKLADLGHTIDHAVLDSEFIVILNEENEDFDEILKLTVEDKEYGDSYFIPIYTDINESKKGVKALDMKNTDFTYEFGVLSGEDIFDIGADDELFVGVVINPFETDFIVPKDDLMTAEAHNH